VTSDVVVSAAKATKKKVSRGCSRLWAPLGQIAKEIHKGLWSLSSETAFDYDRSVCSVGFLAAHLVVFAAQMWDPLVPVFQGDSHGLTSLSRQTISARGGSDLPFRLLH
jgi:hypothetical protein